jgi:hypothetical protein
MRTPEVKERFGYAGKIKARITQSDLGLETKGIDQRDASCWSISF